jgi:tetratricopeptide (TPR) repeat protein
MRSLMAGLTLAFALTIVAAPALAQPAPGDRNRAMGPYKVGFESMRAEQWAEAARSFQQAIDIDPGFDLAYYMLGRVRMAQKQYPDAVAAFSKARDLSLAQAGRQFATAQDRQRDWRDRITQMDEMLRQLRQGPQNNQTQDQIRQVEERRRQLQEAIQQGNGIGVDTTIPAFVSLSLGSAYYRTGNRAEAEKYYKEATTTDPRSGEAHNNLAVVYFETGRAAEAEKELSLAEKAGFKVHPQLKADIQAAKKKTF